MIKPQSAGNRTKYIWSIVWKPFPSVPSLVLLWDISIEKKYNWAPIVWNSFSRVSSFVHICHNHQMYSIYHSDWIQCALVSRIMIEFYVPTWYRVSSVPIIVPGTQNRSNVPGTHPVHIIVPGTQYTHCTWYRVSSAPIIVPSTHQSSFHLVSGIISTHHCTRYPVPIIVPGIGRCKVVPGLDKAACLPIVTSARSHLARLLKSWCHAISTGMTQEWQWQWHRNDTISTGMTMTMTNTYTKTSVTSARRHLARSLKRFRFRFIFNFSGSNGTSARSSLAEKQKHNSKYCSHKSKPGFWFFTK